MGQRIGRTFYLYRRLVGQQLKAILEYQSDFLIMVVSAAMTQLLGILFLHIVYSRIPDINGWGFWEIAFMYAMIYMTEGIGSLFFEGTWRLGRLVNMGELDIYLLRPVSPILQVICSGVGMNGIGNIVTGAIIVTQAMIHIDMPWTWGKIAITIMLLILAVVIRVSINLASNCSAFWIRNAANAFPLMVHNVSEFAKYPLTVFSMGIRVLTTAAIPFAFVSFVPAAYIFEKESTAWLWILSPLVALYCVWMAVFIFKRGLRVYESTGN